MIFNSLQFATFFLIIVSIYYWCPFKYRSAFLLISSYVFYMCWHIEFGLILLLSTVITHALCNKIMISPKKNCRINYLAASLIWNIGILFLFKYYNFVMGSFSGILNYYNVSYRFPELNILLPVGISFYSFKAVSYSIDVYRRDIEVEKNFITFALYISFFPQLLAGPIERATNLLPQFLIKHRFDYDRVTNGLKLIAWGLFKKVVIADRLAVTVNLIYDNPYEYSGLPLIIATIFFTFQIYCDFSGYSDIAIGTAKILGFESKLNFNHPFAARSVSEFWKRWHISLTSWFRDYLYIPMGGNRGGKWRWYLNILIVFLVSGLWHGANWTFVIWGGLHGTYMLVSLLTKGLRGKIVLYSGINKIPYINHFFQILSTFMLVAFAWLFFRANNLSDALYIAQHLFSGVGEMILNISDINYLRHIFIQLGLSKYDLFSLFLTLGILEIVQFFQRRPDANNKFATQPFWIRWTAYYALVLIILFGGGFNSSQNFIYLQF